MIKVPDKILITAIVISSIGLSGCASSDEIKEAYNLGMGDTVKRQYWIIQNRQKESENTDHNVKYYKINSPTNVNGVKFVPHTITVRTVGL